MVPNGPTVASEVKNQANEITTGDFICFSATKQGKQSNKFTRQWWQGVVTDPASQAPDFDFMLQCHSVRKRTILDRIRTDPGPTATHSATAVTDVV